MKHSNLILIGMPAAGKTTVGHILAQRLGRHFLDTDRLLEARTGLALPELMRRRGPTAFREEEQAMLLDLDAEQAVIATGGSVVYSAAGMEALRRLGPRIFLDCSLDVLASRVGDPAARGMVIAPGQTFGELFAQRRPLYQRYAELEIDCDSLPPTEVAEAVLRALPQALS